VETKDSMQRERDPGKEIREEKAREETVRLLQRLEMEGRQRRDALRRQPERIYGAYARDTD